MWSLKDWVIYEVVECGYDGDDDNERVWMMGGKSRRSSLLQIHRKNARFDDIDESDDCKTCDGTSLQYFQTLL